MASNATAAVDEEGSRLLRAARDVIARSEAAEEAETSAVFDSSVVAEDGGSQHAEDEGANLKSACTALATTAAAASSAGVNALPWTLKFASSMGVIAQPAAEAISTVGAALKQAAETDNNDTTEDAAGKASPQREAWQAFAATVVQQLDVASAQAIAEPKCLDSAPLKDALARRNRRLATLSRSHLVFAPVLPGSIAMYDLTTKIMDCVKAPSVTSSSSSSTSSVNWVDETAQAAEVAAFARKLNMHPLRVTVTCLEVLAQLPRAAAGGSAVARQVHARLPVIAAILDRVSADSVTVRNALLSQALSLRLKRMKEVVDPAVAPRGGRAVTVLSRERSINATIVLNREVALLARLVCAGLISVATMLDLVRGTMAHNDFSEEWFESVAAYGRGLAEYGSKAKVEMIIDPKSVRPSELKDAQVIGNNFALLVFPAPRPVWGLAFATGGAIVPKATAVTVCVALLRNGCVNEALDLIEHFRGQEPQADLVLCPNTSTPFGGIASALTQHLCMAFDVVDATGNLASSLTDSHARALWEQHARVVFDYRTAWCSLPAMQSLTAFLDAALRTFGGDDQNQQQNYWHDEATRFLSDIFILSLATLPPSPALSTVAACLARRLPLDTQRELVCDLEPHFLKEDLHTHPLERIESTRHRTLLNSCLNRIASGDPRAYAGLLAPVMNANPFLVANRLLNKAVGYSSDDLLLTNALLVRNALPHFAWVLQTLLLERCLIVASREDRTTATKLNALSSFLAFWWRHSSQSIDAQYIFTFIERMLASSTRAGYLAATALLRNIWRCVLQTPLEHEEQRSSAQEAALAGGKLARWYAAGPGEAFLKSWTRGVYPPRMMRNLDRTLYDVLKQPSTVVHGTSSPSNDDAQVAPVTIGGSLTLLLLRSQATVAEGFSDLPGTTGDVMHAQCSAVDTAGDLARLVYAQSISGWTSSRRLTVVNLDNLATAATAAQALALCAELSAWRDVVPIRSTQQRPPSEPRVEVDLIGMALKAVPNLREVVGLPDEGTPPTGDDAAATDALLAVFWSLGYSDVAERASFGEAYDAANAMVRRYSEKNTAHMQASKPAAAGPSSPNAAAEEDGGGRRRGRFGRPPRRGGDGAEEAEEPRAAPTAFGGALATGASDTRYEYESEASFLTDERRKLDMHRGITHRILQQILRTLSAAVEAGKLLSPVAFAHSCLMARARLSVADAKFAVRFTARLATMADASPLLVAWFVDALCCMLSEAVTLFAGLTTGEVHRVGCACREAVVALDDMVKQQPHVFLRRRVEVETFLAQTAVDLLGDPDLPGQMQRHAFNLFERLRPVFPAFPVSAKILADVASIHAQPSSPHYASATAVSHAQNAKSGTLTNALVQEYVSSPFGTDGAESAVEQLLAASMVDELLQATASRAAAALQEATQRAAGGGAAVADEPSSSADGEEEEEEHAEGDEHDGSSNSSGEDESGDDAADEFVAIANVAGVQPDAPVVVVEELAEEHEDGEEAAAVAVEGEQESKRHRTDDDAAPDALGDFDA